MIGSHFASKKMIGSHLLNLVHPFIGSVKYLLGPTLRSLYNPLQFD